MAIVLAGLVAAMAQGREDETHKGRVFLADDGTVTAVTKTGEAEPAGFTDATGSMSAPASSTPA